MHYLYIPDSLQERKMFYIPDSLLETKMFYIPHSSQETKMFYIPHSLLETKMFTVRRELIFLMQHSVVYQEVYNIIFTKILHKKSFSAVIHCIFLQFTITFEYISTENCLFLTEKRDILVAISNYYIGRYF